MFSYIYVLLLSRSAILTTLQSSVIPVLPFISETVSIYSLSFEDIVRYRNAHSIMSQGSSGIGIKAGASPHPWCHWVHHCVLGINLHFHTALLCICTSVLGALYTSIPWKGWGWRHSTPAGITHTHLTIGSQPPWSEWNQAKTKHSLTWVPIPLFPCSSVAMITQSLHWETLCWQ